MNGLPNPAYIMSEPHLSGYRVILGYETLAEAQDAQSALAQPNGDALRYVDGWLDLSHAPSLGAFIGKSLASFVSGNRMPCMGGDDRERIPDHIRTSFDRACEEVARQALAALSATPAGASDE